MDATDAVDFGRLPEPVLTEHPEWLDMWHLAWRLAARNIRLTHGRRHMDNAWDPARNCQWVWDSCFVALFCRYGAAQFPGMASLDNFYDLQSDDGYISMTYDMTERRALWPDRINPPLFAWTEWEYLRTTGDASRLERVVPHIERFMDWIDANRRTRPHRRRNAPGHPWPGDPAITWPTAGTETMFQLYWFEDCGSSGMDDSPRAPRLAEAGPFYDWIDLSSQMALSFDMLSRLRAAMGDMERAAAWAQRHRELGALINEELWCERTRFYHDRTLPLNFVAHKTVAGFWPMLAGICPPERTAALAAHLQNEKEFNRPVPVPSLSADDLNYCARGTYWRGGVWASTNYMIARGLDHCGRGDLAHDIARRYLDGLVRTCRDVEPHTLWEANSPEETKPALGPYIPRYVKPDFVGWSGIGPTAMLIENIIGIDLDAPACAAQWHIRLTEEHGVRRLGSADFLCRARADANAPAEVEVRSDAALSVRVVCGDRTAEVCIPTGGGVKRITV